MNNNDTKQRENNSCRKLLHIFGWRIYISKVPMRTKGLHCGARRRVHAATWATKEHCCDMCGCETDHYYDMCYHSRLDPTHVGAERWLPENTVMLCKKCNA